MVVHCNAQRLKCNVYQLGCIFVVLHQVLKHVQNLHAIVALLRCVNLLISYLFFCESIKFDKRKPNEETLCLCLREAVWAIMVRRVDYL